MQNNFIHKMKSLVQFIQESSIDESYNADQAKKELKAAAMKRFASHSKNKQTSTSERMQTSTSERIKSLTLKNILRK